MGKLSIIPPSDTIRDNARANSAEGKETTAALVLGSSATCGAIADSAAADCDYRLLIASIDRNDGVLLSSKGGDECRERCSAISGIGGVVVPISDRLVIARQKCQNKQRDTGVSIVTRLREKDTVDAKANLVARDNNVIERTCCTSSDDLAPSFLAWRRARDRRNRRRAVSAPIDVAEDVENEISPSIVDNIAIGLTNQVSKCDGHVDVDINTRNSNNNICNFARLIGLVKASCIFTEEVERRRNTSSSSSSLRFPTRIDHRGGQIWRIKTYRGSPRIGLVLRAFLFGLLMMSLLCDLVLAAPSSSETMDIFEDGIKEEELVIPRNKLGEDELEIIRRSIVQGLGLQRIPDASKVSRFRIFSEN